MAYLLNLPTNLLSINPKTLIFLSWFTLADSLNRQFTRWPDFNEPTQFEFTDRFLFWLRRVLYILRRTLSNLPSPRLPSIFNFLLEFQTAFQAVSMNYAPRHFHGIKNSFSILPWSAVSKKFILLLIGWKRAQQATFKMLFESAFSTNTCLTDTPTQCREIQTISNPIPTEGTPKPQTIKLLGNKLGLLLKTNREKHEDGKVVVMKGTSGMEARNIRRA